VTITYTDAEVEGLDEATLRVFRFNPDTSKYDIEITTIVGRDTANNTISFTVTGFSKFGLGANGDTDGDGLTDDIDPDDDNDGAPDGEDPFPLDTDNDGIDNGDDPDDDADGIPDGDDDYPLDTDNDGRNNAEDYDDDGDGVSDALEIAVGTNPLDAGDVPDVPLNAVPTAIALILILSGFALGRMRQASPRRVTR